MKRMFWLFLGAVAMVAIPAGTGTAHAAELKVGDQAPAFELIGSDGKTHSLADFHGKSAVVLAWFPKAHTGGCTAECKSFKANGNAIRKFQVAYFTASVDQPKDNKSFAEDLGVDYPILSDPGRKVARAYGVVDDKHKYAQRWTFYIGTDGKILAIDKSVKTGTHGSDVATKLKELGVTEK